MCACVCVCAVEDSHMCMQSSGFNYEGGKGEKRTEFRAAKSCSGLC